jgi:putative colanic acid biosynthesis glycosyltransferase
VIALDIVTVHLNNFDGLERTRQSVARLRLKESFRWLVIDGASCTTNDEERLAIRLARDDSEDFSSEPDQGIYDAMNRGARRCTGEYVLFLNSGDELHPEFSINQVDNELGESRPGMVWGACYERFPNGALVRTAPRSPRLAWYGIPVNHQSVLFRRDILGSNPYDCRYSLCADYDLICRLLLSNAGVNRLTMPIAIFERGGRSSIAFDACLKEEEVLRSLHFGLSRSTARLISNLKKITQKLGRIPPVRRLMRKWI